MIDSAEMRSGMHLSPSGRQMHTGSQTRDPGRAGISTETGLGLDQVRFFGNPAFQRWGIECEEFG